VTGGEEDSLRLGFRRISTVRALYTETGERRSAVVLLLVCGMLSLSWPAAVLLEMSLAQRGSWIAAGWSLYYGAATVLSIYLQARTWKELYNCRAEIGSLLDRPENKSVLADRLLKSYSSKRRPIFMLVAIGLVLLIMKMLADTSARELLQSFGIVAYCQMALHGAVLLVAGYWLLKIPRVISHLTKLDGLKVNELEPIEHPAIRELSILFSKAGLRAATGILISGIPVILLVSALRVEWFTWLSAAIVSVGAFVAVSVFALPQVGMHELAVKTILRTKARISSEVNVGDQMSALVALHKYQVVSAAKTWAVDLTVLSRYGLALLGPVLPILIRLYVGADAATP